MRKNLTTPTVDEPDTTADITEEIKIGDDIVTYINGKFDCVHSLKYGAYFEIVDGEPRFWTNPYHLNSDKFDFRDADRWCEDDWFDIMIKRGACIIGEPADDFNSQLAELTAAAKAAHAAEKNAMHELDKACDTYHKAEETWRQARLHMRDAEFAVEQFLAGKAKDLRDNLLDNDIFDGTIAIIAQDGKRFDEPELGQIWIDATQDDKFAISSMYKHFAIYDTPAQVTAIIGRLKDAIVDGATEFKFPTVDELNQPHAPTFETGKAYYQRDWSAYTAATSTKPYYIIKRTAKYVFVSNNPADCDPEKYLIRNGDDGEFFQTFDWHKVYASYNA